MAALLYICHVIAFLRGNKKLKKKKDFQFVLEVELFPLVGLLIQKNLNDIIKRQQQQQQEQE